MTEAEGAVGRKDRARAFVAELLPEPQDIERTGPLTPKEQQTLGRVHAARDHHQAAKWMRGKALAVAFSRRLYRGEDGERTRQEYLDDEWDGISESAAYREIGEWPVAKAISDACERPAPDSHVRALLDVADKRGAEPVARWYAELRRHGRETGRRVTADVVANLADFLREGTEPERLETLFVPRQIASTTAPGPAGRTGRGTGEPVTGTVLPHVQHVQAAAFPNLGTPDGHSAAPVREPGRRWVMSTEHVGRLSAWLATEAHRTGISPEHAADLLLQALADGRSLHDWIGPRAGA